MDIASNSLYIQNNLAFRFCISPAILYICRLHPAFRLCISLTILYIPRLYLSSCFCIRLTILYISRKHSAFRFWILTALSEADIIPNKKENMLHLIERYQDYLCLISRLVSAFRSCVEHWLLFFLKVPYNRSRLGNRSSKTGLDFSILTFFHSFHY